MNISVVIPVYNKKEIFLENLQHNMKFFKGYELIVVDDASTEDIAKVIKSKYPNITLIRNKKNLGFAPTANVGLRKAKGDLVILLNTDVKINKYNEKSILDSFNDNNNLFALSFAQEPESKSKILEGKNVIDFVKGMPVHSRSNNDLYGTTAWAEGGSCVFRKKYLTKLNEFSEIYAPFYWEDIDLSYRAHKSGYEVLFTPDIVVEHKHGSTIDSYYKKKEVKAIALRNQFFFAWINLDFSTLVAHVVFLPIYLLQTLLRGDSTFLTALITAAKEIGTVMTYRNSIASRWKHDDRKLFDKLSNC